SSKREAAMLLPAAETFSTIEALLDGTYERYPAKELAHAWAASIFDDHGWGGNQGQITDQLFRSKLDSARDAGRELLGQALGRIGSRIRFPRNAGTPIVVFNALSWQRTDPVVCSVSLDSPDLRVTDADGWPMPYQVSPAEPGQPAAARKIMFIARNVPSVGYKTYYVLSRKQTGKKEAPSIQISNQVIENKFYRITLLPGGIKSIVDKELKLELLNDQKFLGAELFTMRSVGNGAGEFGQTQQPTMEEFDRLSLHKPTWRQCESGPVFTAFVLEQRLPTCTLRQKLVVYQDLKRIDMEASILGWNGAPYREFRMALPLKMDKGIVSYEVPMGVVTVGKDEMPGAAGLAYGSVNYSQPCNEAHPREVQNFISASDGRLGVTMSSSVAVCDFMDPTADPVTYPVLQPILLASRKSCHGLGNWYLQEGDHHYRFSIFSHASGWENGYREAIQANNPLIPVVGPAPGTGLSLPMEKSFFSTSGNNVLLSTIKKCDDDDQVIARCYEMEGRDSDVQLQLPVSITRAELTNIIEEEGKVIPSGYLNIAVKFGHHAIETFKLFPATPVRAEAGGR
ncbi:alpha-mannosidase, partial [bacterium]